MVFRNFKQFNLSDNILLDIVQEINYAVLECIKFKDFVMQFNSDHTEGKSRNLNLVLQNSTD
jgi:hypothetical protein